MNKFFTSIVSALNSFVDWFALQPWWFRLLLVIIILLFIISIILRIIAYARHRCDEY